MNRIEAKEFYPIMQAFAEGKAIECRTRTWELNKGWQYSTTWKETEELKFQDTYEYRIKPESKYRPFKDTKECWQEMKKHQPFGWIIGKEDEHHSLITSIITDEEEVDINGISGFVLDEIMERYTFDDGAPFGVKVEE